MNLVDDQRRSASERRAIIIAISSGAFVLVEASRLFAHWTPFFTSHWQWRQAYLTGIYIPSLKVDWGIDIAVGTLLSGVTAFFAAGRSHPGRYLRSLSAIVGYLSLFIFGLFVPILFFLGRLPLAPPRVQEPFTVGSIGMLFLGSALFLGSWSYAARHRTRRGSA